ncbi:hypothetical protein PVAP13_1KG241825 [Panicum virgatum]|uniref:Uncharacterized protein n=1 Tax=Panicum virgatum TaxID=38727 RepID=A0A8T0XF35_PANVG|nr:hypothetical protein PVAP13_1KG241825 [Panicum virgatum]
MRFKSYVREEGKCIRFWLHQHTLSFHHLSVLLGQLSESTGQYDWLLSEHDNLLHDRDRVVHEVEELCQRRGQMHSVLVTSTYSEFSSSELESATENFSSSLKIGEGGFACVQSDRTVGEQTRGARRVR